MAKFSIGADIYPIRKDFDNLKENLVTHTTLIAELVSFPVFSDEENADYKDAHYTKCGKLLKRIIRKGKDPCAQLCTILKDQEYVSSQNRQPVFEMYIPPLFLGFKRLEGTGPENNQQTMQKMPDEKRKGSDTNTFLTFAAETNDISSLNHSLKIKRSTVAALCSQFLPCAGGSDLGDIQHKEQAGSDIYQHTLRTVSHCPSASDYIQRATDRCAEVCTNNIQDDGCSYHCMRDSYKTSLVEFCAKPKFLFDYCPEYDPIGERIQKDIYTLCKHSNPLERVYSSSDLFFCDQGNCLQLRDAGVSTSVTSLMTDTTPVSGELNESWLSQYWFMVLLFGVAMIICIVLGCIFRLRGKLMAISRKWTKKKNPNNAQDENEQAALHKAA